MTLRQKPAFLLSPMERAQRQEHVDLVVARTAAGARRAGIADVLDVRAPRAMPSGPRSSVTPSQMQTYTGSPSLQEGYARIRPGMRRKTPLRWARAAGGVPPQARRGAHPGARPRGRSGARHRRPLRGAGAPRPQPALGRAAGARRRAGVVGGAQGPAHRAGHGAAGRAHRGPPDRVPGVLRGDPGGRVRRRPHDDLGHRHLRDGEVEPAGGHRPAARAPGRGPLRLHPHRRQLDPAPLRPGPDRDPLPRDTRPMEPHPGPAPPRRRTGGCRCASAGAG